MSTELADRIKVRLDKTGMNEAQASRKAGLGETFIRDVRRKGSMPSAENLRKLADALDCTVDYLLGKEARPRLVHSYDPDAAEKPNNDERMSMGSETGFTGAPEGSSPQIDLTAGMGAGGLSITDEGVPGKHGMTFSAESVKDYWKLPPAILVTLGLAAKDIAIFPVQGDSMQPTLIEGDVVFIDTRHRRPSPDGIYAIIDEIGGMAIKRLEVTSEPGAEEVLVSVISDNPRHKTKVWKAEDLYVVGRVLRKFGNV